MTTHPIANREDWLEARRALLEAEKALTRQSDAVAQQRQALPWVRIDKDYCFETEAGTASLADLFAGRSQLLVYHFMFGPDYAAGCPSCSAIADGFNGITVHLHNHDVALVAVSRAPLAKLLPFKARMGWSFPWVSSASGDFNYDFNVSFTPEQEREGAVDYNFRREPPREWRWNQPGSGGAENRFAQMAGTDTDTYRRERPGLSAFVREDGAIYHSYSSYSRGMDAIWAMYPWLDRAPKGRNETGPWWRHHDAYEEPAPAAVQPCCA
jgi:predicted dithiol-disulfide oxidoreductase (DUF899 family)